MIAGLLVLVFTQQLFSRSIPASGVQVVAFIIFLWARIVFGRRSYHVVADPTAGGLVTTGPYRYIRHPIYAAFCIFVWAGVVAHPSWVSILCGAAVLIGAVVRIYCEETLVAGQYPAYVDYKAKTWRLIPYIY